MESGSESSRNIGDQRTKMRLRRDREWSTRESEIIGKYEYPEYRAGSGPGFQSGDTVDADMASVSYEDLPHVAWRRRRRKEEAPRLGEARRELERRWQEQEAQWLREDGVDASDVGPRCEACHAPVVKGESGPKCPYCDADLPWKEEALREERIKGIVGTLVKEPRWRGDTSERDRAMDKLIKLGSVAVPTLVSALDDEREAMRAVLVKVLGDIGDERAVSALVRLLDEAEGDLREGVLSALARIGGPRAAEALAARPQEAKRMVDDLVTATREQKWSARDKAAKKLKKLGPSAIPHLLSAVDEEDDAVRWSVAELLGDIGDRSAVGALTALLEDEAEGVREAASIALERIESR